MTRKLSWCWGVPLLVMNIFGGGFEVVTASPANVTDDPSSSRSWDDFTIESALEQYEGQSTRPNEHYERPDRIMLDFLKVRVDEVDQLKQEFQIVMTLYQSWTDDRLQNLLPWNSETMYSIRGASVDKIWLPDLHFPLLKSGEKVISTNRFLRVDKEFGIVYGHRLSLTQSCKMDFTMFPFDTQTCDTIITTLSYDNAELLLEWDDSDKDPKLAAKLNNLQFRRPLLETSDCTISEDFARNGTYFNISYTCLRISISMERKSVYYVFTNMTCMLLLALLSWLNYWLDPEQTPARVSLGITTVLSAITQITNSMTGLPKLSYITLLEMWMYTCLYLIILSLCEYAVVHILVFGARRLEKELKCQREASLREAAGVQLAPTEAETSFSRDAGKLANCFADQCCWRSAAVGEGRPPAKPTPEELALMEAACRKRRLARSIDVWTRRITPIVLVVTSGFLGVLSSLSNEEDIQRAPYQMTFLDNHTTVTSAFRVRLEWLMAVMEFFSVDGRPVDPASPEPASSDDRLSTIEDFLELSTAELRYFLLHLGESIAGCRAELAERAVFARQRSRETSPCQPKKFKLERGQVKGEYASVLDEYGLTDPDAAGGWCVDISTGLPSLDLGKIFHYVLTKEAFDTYYLSEYRNKRAFRYLEAVCVRSIQLRPAGDFAFIKGAVAPLSRAGDGFDADRPPHAVKVLTATESGDVVVSCCSCTGELYQCCNHVVAVLLRVERLRREMTARESGRRNSAESRRGAVVTAAAVAASPRPPVKIADLLGSSPSPVRSTTAAAMSEEERRDFVERVCRTLPNCLFARTFQGVQTSEVTVKTQRQSSGRSTDHTASVSGQSCAAANGQSPPAARNSSAKTP